MPWLMGLRVWPPGAIKSGFPVTAQNRGGVLPSTLTCSNRESVLLDIEKACVYYEGDGNHFLWRTASC